MSRPPRSLTRKATAPADTLASNSSQTEARMIPKRGDGAGRPRSRPAGLNNFLLTLSGILVGLTSSAGGSAGFKGCGGG